MIDLPAMQRSLKKKSYAPRLKKGAEAFCVIFFVSMLIFGQILYSTFIIRTMKYGERVTARESGLSLLVDEGVSLKKLKELPIVYKQNGINIFAEVVHIQMVKDKIVIEAGGTYTVAIDPTNNRRALLAHDNITIKDYRPWINFSTFFTIIFLPMIIYYFLLLLRK